MRSGRGNGECLLADIGGTNIRFAIGAGSSLENFQSFKVADFETVEQAVEQYLESTGSRTPVNACFAVACPIQGDRVQLTNNSWSFSASELGQRLGLSSLLIVNDFKALAAAVPSLGLDQLLQIGSDFSGPDSDFPTCVVGPGTGLGTAIIGPRNKGSVIIDGEGGHMGFAPATDEENEIWRILKDRFGRVSYERLLSGDGLENIYLALNKIESKGVYIPRLSAADILNRAISMETDELAERTLKVFCAVFGSYAGDIALLSKAYGGVYLGGGILPRMFPFLQRSDFRQRFDDKGRMGKVTSQIPTFAITTKDVALRGCCRLRMEIDQDGEV